VTDDEAIAHLVAVDPEVAQLTAYLERELPPNLRDLVTHDYTCAIRRATVAAMLARDHRHVLQPSSHIAGNAMDRPMRRV